MRQSFGMTKDGKEAFLYTLTNKQGMIVTVSDYGATLVSVLVPDRNGKVVDVVLGYDDVIGYEESTVFLGATVGRNANRIHNAAFVLNGQHYVLEKNDNGNNLHSGMDFYCKRVWTVKEADDTHIAFSLVSSDGDQGYPGELHVLVIYRLTENNELKIEYELCAKQETIANLTNHSYFNLSGADSGDVLRQKVWIHADAFTMSDKESIPTGEIVPVNGTPMDFRVEKEIGRDMEDEYEALKLGNGYDHNWLLNGSGSRKVATMRSDESNITMEVWTDLPGMQFYTGNFIEQEKGKKQATYRKRQGACFETQYFPDAINQPTFVKPIIKQGETMKSTTSYKFS